MANYSFGYPQQQAFQFPQPQGNVYMINNSLEVANVPLSGGMSIALCMNENLMYIKMMQNGSPILMSYKLELQSDTTNKNNIEDRLDKIEKKINELYKNKGGSLNELI